MNIYYQQFSHLNSNLHFLNRYLKLISIFKERNLKKAKGLYNHHIFPKSFDGEENSENMVYLTQKEHFIIHHLLWKSFPGNQSMNYAFFRMSHTKKYKNRITSRVFEQLRTEFGEQNKKPHSEETKIKIGDALRGRTISDEQKQKLSDALRGRIFSEEHRQKIGAANRLRITSEETRQKISDANKGRPISEKSKENLKKPKLAESILKRTETRRLNRLAKIQSIENYF